MTAFIVKYYIYTIGTADFLHAFFSTVCGQLENEKWGSRFPPSHERAVSRRTACQASRSCTEELSQIKQELARFAPDQVIWDIDDRSLTPPWGDNISNDITDLSNYFVTSEGEDFLSVFAAALDKAQQRNASLKIQTI